MGLGTQAKKNRSIFDHEREPWRIFWKFVVRTVYDNIKLIKRPPDEGYG